MQTFTADSVDILDAVTGEVVTRCQGPDQTGACPHRVGGVVRCAGHRVASSKSNRGVAAWGG
jgi:hypothetical protein